MSPIFTISQRLGACLALLLLGACSALHVDVDVYKGPLANHEDIQLRQYAALAIAAKPIIAALRNEEIFDREYDNDEFKEYRAHDVACMEKNGKGVGYDGFVPCHFQLDIPHFLNQVLELYENRSVVDKAFSTSKEVSHTPATSTKRLKASKSGTPAVIARPDDGLAKLAQDLINSNNDCQNDACKVKHCGLKTCSPQSRLNEALIIFAEKVLFVVNNHDLAFPTDRYDDGWISGAIKNTYYGWFGGEKYRNFAQKMAVLQSLGNNIIVHADDLRRRGDHDKKLQAHGSMELRAAQQSFSLSAPQAYDGLTNEVKKQFKATLAGNPKLQPDPALPKAVPDLKRKVEKAKEAMEETKSASSEALDAWRTLFGSFDLPDFAKEDKNAAADRKAIAALLEKTTEKKSFKEVLTMISGAIDSADSSQMIALGSSQIEATRRQAAKTYLIRIAGKDLKIEDGLPKALAQSFKTKLLEALGNARQILTKQQAELNAAQANLSAANTKVSEDIATKTSLKKAEEESQARIMEILVGLKTAMLAKADAAKVGDMAGLRSLLLQDLPAPLSKADAKDQANAKLATAILQRMTPLASTVGTLPNANEAGETKQKDGNKDADKPPTQKDVIDTVIAELRYMQIQATRAGSTEEQQTNIRNALALAYEQRAGMAYLRPASSYLRNAYANTTIQGSSSNSANLIKPNLGFGNLYDRAFMETKLEIDKQYWQNINSIKVQGGVSADYALVKDDVGNWYVKGLSADPEALIRSAQNLALFNMGGKINVNLLQQLDDKRQLDKATTESERTSIRERMNKAKAGTAANTDGISLVNVKFRAEYQKQSMAQLNKLNEELDKLPDAMSSAWAAIEFGTSKDSSTAALVKALGSPNEVKLAKEAITEAKNKADAKNTEPDELSNIMAEAAISALRQIRNLRIRLTREIQAESGVIKEANDANDKAQKDLAAQVTAVKALETARETALTAERAAREKLPNPPKEPEQTNLANASIALKAAEEKLVAGKTALETQKTAAEDAAKALKKAIENRKLAAKKAGGVLNNMLETTSSKRLDTVNAYETAITFIGLTVEGK